MQPAVLLSRACAIAQASGETYIDGHGTKLVGQNPQEKIPKPTAKTSLTCARSRHASRWNALAIGPKIAELASRHSERDECRHLIEMHRHFPHGFSGQCTSRRFTRSEAGCSRVQVRLSSLVRRTVANKNRLKACACSLGRDSDQS